MSQATAAPQTAPQAATAEAEAARPQGDSRRIDRFLRLMMERGASDLHLSVGRPPMFRLSGELDPIRYRTLSEQDFETLIRPITPPHLWADWLDRGDIDYAYQLGDLKLWKGVTDEKGRFLFEQLPAGLYMIIAAKTGFLPAVVQITRNSAGKRQWVDVQLVKERPGVVAEAGFWSVREQIPPDILRQMDLAGELALAAGPGAQEVQLQARLQALTGLDERLPGGAAQLTGGRVDLSGEIRDVRLDLEGNFSQLQPVLVLENTVIQELLGSIAAFLISTQSRFDQ